jgi:phage-related protein
MLDKPIDWVGKSFQTLKEFQEEARREAGFQLRLVQQGIEPEDWKPMSSIGLGVMEIRIHEPHEHRIIYVAKFPEAVYVLHAFEKKTQKTPQRDIETARKAYAEVQKRRRK